MSPGKWKKLENRSKEKSEDKGCYVPTPEEIEIGTAEIRKTWDEDTMKSRYVGEASEVVELKQFQDPTELFRLSHHVLHVYR